MCLETMDLSLKNYFRHIKNLWPGEELIRKSSSPTVQENNDQKAVFSHSKQPTALVNKSPADLTSLIKEDSIGCIDTSSVLDHDRISESKPQLTGSGAVGDFDLTKRELRFEILMSNLLLFQSQLKMASLVGTYQHERNENIDEFFKSLGVPFFPRKMMGMSRPRLEITCEDDKWTIRTVSMMRTVELKFVLGEEYEEPMPSGETLKSVTTMEGDSLLTVSVAPDDSKLTRTYEFSDDGVVLTMTNEKAGQVAKRYFKRLP